LFRRALLALASPSPGYSRLQTSWGVPLLADPTKTIGRSILTTGVYDIAVSELMARLIGAGDTVIDAGANIGYMTLLASVVAGPGGNVLAFEPHPDLFRIMQQNVTAARNWLCIANTQLDNSALGDWRGTADLLLPADFDSNDGVARIAPTTNPAGCSMSVTMKTLDDVLGNETAAVLKLDVEGFEPQVLRGAVRALQERRIQHIIFEEHDIEASEVVPVLRAGGFQVYSLGWSIHGIVLSPVETGSLAAEYEAPNFVASINPNELLSRCEPRGWLVLGRNLLTRCLPSSNGTG
jgi:FkbM family methyltransferase